MNETAVTFPETSSATACPIRSMYVAGSLSMTRGATGTQLTDEDDADPGVFARTKVPRALCASTSGIRAGGDGSP